MAAPFEIVAAPLTVYLAPVATAFPLLDVAPSGSWTKLGTSGDKNYEEEGVKATHDQKIEVFRSAGGTGPRKAWRTEEDFLLEFTLVDLTPEQYAKVLNDATVTTVAGPPATKKFNIQQGLVVAQFALLARGKSTVDDTKSAQYEVSLAIQAGNPEPAFNKGKPAGLACQFQALEHATTGFGVLNIAT